MAVAIWTPLKIPMLQPMSAASTDTIGDNCNADMEESDRIDSKSSMEDSSSVPASIIEDVMEVM